MRDYTSLACIPQGTALAIRGGYRRGLNMTQLSIQYSVSHGTVSNVVRGLHITVRGLPNISRGRGMPPDSFKFGRHRR